MTALKEAYIFSITGLEGDPGSPSGNEKSPGGLFCFPGDGAFMLICGSGQEPPFDDVRICVTVPAMKSATLSTRVDAGLIARLAKFEERTGVEKATLVRAALTAALDCYERQGRIAFPLVIADSSQYPKAKGG